MTSAEWDTFETEAKIRRGLMPKDWRYTTSEVLLHGKKCDTCGRALDVPDTHQRGEDGRPLFWAFLSPFGGAYCQMGCTGFGATKPIEKSAQ